MRTRNNFVEKYRPETIEDCVLRESIYRKANKYIMTGEIPNLLLKGSPGTGKTSFARALGKDLDVALSWWSSRTLNEVRDHLASSECCCNTIYGQSRIVVLDEFDHATKDVQKMLLKPMEGVKNSFNAWILIVNDASKLEDTVLSRVHEIDFDIPASEKDDTIDKYISRCAHVLSKEKIVYKEKDIFPYVLKYFPGLRKILNELEGGIDLDNNLLPLHRNSTSFGSNS